MSKNLAVVDNDRKMVQDVIDVIMDAAKTCPNPTQKEIRTLLAVQGAALHQYGVSLLNDLTQKGKLERRTDLILRVWKQSRECLVSASNIITEPDLELKSDSK